MNNKIFTILISAAFLAAVLPSCRKQDDIYKQYVKVGGYVYPAKAINESYTQGYKRVILHWTKPMDPAVKTAKVFWENYQYSKDVDYSQFPDGEVSVSIDGLEERTYSFDIVNYDSSNHSSLAVEVTAAPYGDFWLSSNSERTLKLARMVEGQDSAMVILSKSTDRMMSTKFRYVNNQGQTVEYDKLLYPGSDTVYLPHPKKGRQLEYASAFCPEDGADTVYNYWTKSAAGIEYRLDVSGFTATITKNQTQGTNTVDKIFDGIYTSASKRWQGTTNSSYRKIFPKYITVDAGTEYTFSTFDFYQNPSAKGSRWIKNAIIYVTDEPFDPDTKENYEVILGEPYCRSTFVQENQITTMSLMTSPRTGRYFTIVFTNSYSSSNYLDLWELMPYGCLPSEMAE